MPDGLRRFASRLEAHQWLRVLPCFHRVEPGRGGFLARGRLPEKLGAVGVELKSAAYTKTPFQLFDFPVVPVGGINLAFLHGQFQGG